jgi:hypothetical protein
LAIVKISGKAREESCAIGIKVLSKSKKFKRVIKKGGGMRAAGVRGSCAPAEAAAIK